MKKEKVYLLSFRQDTSVHNENERKKDTHTHLVHNNCKMLRDNKNTQRKKSKIKRELKLYKPNQVL